MLTIIELEMYSNIIIVEDINTQFTLMNRSLSQKINRETQALKDTLDQLDLIDIYRAFHLKTIDFTFFSSAHGPLSRIDHISGPKLSHSKFLKIETISSIFSDHNTI